MKKTIRAKNLMKEIVKLKRENKKLKAALNEEGIEPETEVLGKKLGDILTGKELRIAAEKGLKVRYVERHDNPSDRHMNYNANCIMKMKMDESDLGYEGEYYIGDSSIDINVYEDNEKVTSDFGEGIFEVRKAKGVKYD